MKILIRGLIGLLFAIVTVILFDITCGLLGYDIKSNQFLCGYLSAVAFITGQSLYK